MNRFLSNIFTTLSYLGYQGFLISASFLLLISLIIIPVSRGLLDLLLICNLVLSLIVLLRALSINSPVKLFVFPAILLFGTLVRLSLNVSSTRLILLNGDQGIGAAGEVIKAFGSLVVQNDFIVGAIIFSLITLVNFLVISKGSARVAEVAARFALDSLPGKQLAIDADLRAGNISQEEASKRREALTQESQFYGSMDGAMKFVQGDAIASLIIVGINSLGGVLVGANKGIEITEAIKVYGVLTIGDGLINIIPSLLMSLAAGIVITNIKNQKSQGPSSEIFLQLIAEPRVLFLVASLLLLLSFLPGLPFVPFFLVAILLLCFTLVSQYILAKGKENISFGNSIAEIFKQQLKTEKRNAISWQGESLAITTESKEEKIKGMSLEILKLEIDPNFLEPMLRKLSPNGDLTNFQELYQKKAEEFYRTRGLPLPALKITSNGKLEKFEYQIFLREKNIKSAKIKQEQYFVVSQQKNLDLYGVIVGNTEQHPLSSRKGFWVKLEDRSRRSLETLGIEVITPEEFIVLEIIAVCLDRVDELLALNEIKLMINELKENNIELIQEVFDKEVITYPEFTELLRRLFNEAVNIRDLKLILEGIAEYASFNQDNKDRQDWLNQLHAFIRINFSGNIWNSTVNNGNKVRVFSLSENIESVFRDVLADWSGRKRKPPLEPDFEFKLSNISNKLFTPVLEQGELPIIILSSSDVRAIVQEFYQRKFSNNLVKVLAYPELESFSSPEFVTELEMAE